MPKPRLSPRKAPQQERSRAMVDLILAAAARVLERESLAGFNTNRVAEVAGISIGSLYQYFPNKSALVTALIEQAHTELAQQVQQTMARLPADASLLQALHAMAKLSVTQQYGNPVLAAALDHEEKRLPIQDRLATAEDALLATLERFFSRYAAHIAQPLPPAAARDCLDITRALVEADMELGRRPRADLEQRIVRALYGYLTVSV